MTREVAKIVVLQVIQEALEADRLPVPPLEETTDPIRNLGLDSLAGVDAASEFSRRLPIDIEPDSNPFLDDENHRSRNIGEIIDYLVAKAK